MIKNLRLQYIFSLIFIVTSISFWLLHTHKEDKIETDKNRIIQNLTSIEDALRQRRKHNLSTEQQANRIIALDILKEYIEVARFPKNNQISTRIPIFKDNEGTWCAVGYMLASTGYQQLAEKINSINTFIYIDEIEDFESQGIGKWAKVYGFDQAELAMIQPGYGPLGAIAAIIIHGTIRILTPVERLFFHHIPQAKKSTIQLITALRNTKSQHIKLDRLKNERTDNINMVSGVQSNPPKSK